MALAAHASVVIFNNLLLAIIVIFLFAFYHGAKRYGWKNIFIFFLFVFGISWSYETLSILTGFPFGNYYYAEAFQPKLWLVPLMAMPAYFALGYYSWTIASILLKKKDAMIKGMEVVLVPLLATFVMVMWDLCLDPVAATINRLWIWQDGGAYFGVPFSNFLGWSLCVFTFYFVFAFYLHRSKDTKLQTPVTAKSFWILPVIMYLVYVPQYFRNAFWGKNFEVVAKNGHTYWTGDINQTLFLVSLFTMVFVAFLSLVSLYRTEVRSKSPSEGSH